MKMCENLKKTRENHIKTISLGERLRYDLSALLGPLKLMPNCSVGPSECETKFSSEEIWYGLHENAWFPWQTLI